MARPRAAASGGVVRAFPRFETVVLVVYALLVSVVSALHEPWKDETQAWRLAIDSHGVADLVRNARYEGHPLLWHLMLQALGHLSRAWWPVVVLHIVIACVGAWLVLRYAPFTRLQKVLIVFGYWSAYEYAIVVRPYGLGMALAIGACIAWTAPRRRFAWTVVCLALLANTTAMGTLLAMALAAALAFDWAWPDDPARRPSRRTVAWVGLGSLVIMLVVVYVALVQIRPPADAALQAEVQPALTRWDIATIPTFELRALMPFVRLEDGVRWNQSVFEPGDSRYDLALAFVLSLVVLTIGVVIAARRRMSLVFYLGATAGYLLFFKFIFSGASYHHGYLFIVWLLAAWLAWSAPPSDEPRALRRLTAAADRIRPNLFVISLIPPVFAAAELAVADAVSPFADARHVADVIRDHGLADAPLISIVRPHAQSVGAFLDRPVLYPLERKTLTFVYWGPPSPYPATLRAADSAATALLTSHCRVVLISSRTHDVSPEIAARARLLYTTLGRPLSGDYYRVWVMSAPPSARCPANSTR